MSLDEEYTRTVFCAQATAYDHSVAVHLCDTKVIRSFKRSPKFLNLIAGRMQRVTLMRRDGRLAPNQTVIPVDLRRVERVMRKITKGLFYHMTQTALPPEYEVEAFAAVEPDEANRLVANMSLLQRFGPHKLDDGSVFQFLGGRTASFPNLTAWIMVFYDRIVAVSHTRTKEPNLDGDD